MRKDHPIIVLRGKLDSLAAHIINAQVCAWQSGQRECVDELQPTELEEEKCFGKT